MLWEYKNVKSQSKKETKKAHENYTTQCNTINPNNQICLRCVSSYDTQSGNQVGLFNSSRNYRGIIMYHIL